jgi:hypothetical protein
MRTLRDYINLIEGLSAPKFYIQERGEDSTVVQTESGIIVYAGSVAECRAWIKQQDPQGHYAFEEDIQYVPTNKPELTAQERQARLDAVNRQRQQDGSQQRDQQAWQQQQDQFKDLYAKTTPKDTKDTR